MLGYQEIFLQVFFYALALNKILRPTFFQHVVSPILSNFGPKSGLFQEVFNKKLFVTPSMQLVQLVHDLSTQIGDLYKTRMSSFHNILHFPLTCNCCSKLWTKAY